MQGNDTAERWSRAPDKGTGPGRVGVTVISLAGLLAIWIVAAALTADPQILPQPWDLVQPFAQALEVIMEGGELFLMAMLGGHEAKDLGTLKEEAARLVEST